MLAIPPAKEAFQYRVVVSGETMRHIAPAEDLEILDAMTEVVCFRCHYAFRTKPGVVRQGVRALSMRRMDLPGLHGMPDR